MANALSELVRFVGEEAALVSRVKQAVEWIASKAEGRTILEEARALHGKPLDIICDAAAHFSGYGDHLGNHLVYANPILLDKLQLFGKNGEVIANSLERFFAHEFKHAAQPNVLRHAQEYMARRQQMYMENIPRIPFDKYTHRIGVTMNDDAALKRVFGEMYDEHVAPHASQAMNTIVEKLTRDSTVQKFVKEFETPAIDFENVMMTKYRGEPARTTDYLKSASFEEYPQAIDRDGFIDSALAGLRTQVPPQKVTSTAIRVSGKEAKGIRSDADGKVSVETERG